VKRKKLPAPHEVVKSYVKTAQERLKEVFFARPEWRQPKSPAAVDVVISCIDEIYYPFSTRDRHVVAVWKQVLKEKREELLEQLKSKRGGDAVTAKGAAPPPAADAGKGNPGRGADRVPPAASAPKKWTEGRAAKLRKEIREGRALAKIARLLGVSYQTAAGYIKWPGRRNSDAWLTRIQDAFEMLKARPEISAASAAALQSGLDILVESMHASIKDDQAVIAGSKREELAKTIDFGTRPELRSDARGPFDFPQRAAYPGGSMTTDLKDGQLFITVRVDVAEAIRMAAQQLAIEINKAPHDHSVILKETPNP